MSERGSSAVITLGGKGASLTSSSVYAIPNSLVHVRLDSSALDRLSSSPPNQDPPTVTDYQVPLLKALTLEESRASLTVLLNKLLSLQSGLGVRAVLSVHISEILNSGGDKIASESVEVSEDERALLEKLSLPSVFCGVCAVLDYKSTALSTIIDAMAALLWEVSGADVAAFNSIDSGDGFTAKEEIAVAGDLKVLLNGSKLVGKVNTEEVLEILKINGKLRVVKLVHSSTRIELKSGVRVGMSGTAKALGANVMALVSAVKNVGESSLFLAKMSLSKVGGDELKSLFGKDCLSLDSLRSVYKLVLDAHLAEDYIKFVHEANVLLELVLKIVVWETVIAIAVLTNHFKVNVTNVNGHFFHYSVSLSYEDGCPVDGKGIGRRVIDRVQETYDNELAGKHFAYDGEKGLSIVGPLPRNKLEFTVMLEEISSSRNNGNGSPDGCENPSANDRKRVRRPYRSKTYKVEISFVAKIPMQSIANALRGQESENSQEALRVLDIILRQHAAKHGCLLIRQSFFHNDPKNFAKVEGRVLPAPRLKVGNGEDFFLRNGRWNFNNKKLVEPTKMKRWAVVNFSARCDIRSLVRDLKKCGDMKGLKEDLLEEQLEGESEYKYSSHSDLEVLNKWKGLPDCKWTWESCDNLQYPFPQSHLEDKVSLDGRRNVRTHIYIFRRKRENKKSCDPKAKLEGCHLIANPTTKNMKRGRAGENEMAVERVEKGSRCGKKGQVKKLRKRWGESGSLEC